MTCLSVPRHDWGKRERYITCKRPDVRSPLASKPWALRNHISAPCNRVFWIDWTYGVPKEEGIMVQTLCTIPEFCGAFTNFESHVQFWAFSPQHVKNGLLFEIPSSSSGRVRGSASESNFTGATGSRSTAKLTHPMRPYILPNPSLFRLFHYSSVSSSVKTERGNLPVQMCRRMRIHAVCDSCFVPSRAAEKDFLPSLCIG